MTLCLGVLLIVLIFLFMWFDVSLLVLVCVLRLNWLFC